MAAETDNESYTPPSVASQDSQLPAGQNVQPPVNKDDDSETADAIDFDDGSDFHPDFRFFLAWISICVVVLMAALDATSLSVALPQIALVLQGDAIEAFWAGTSFLLTSTVFQPVIGSMSNIFGRVPLLFTSLALFGIGAIVAAVAKSGDGMATMLIGRSIQGIGGGGIIVLGEIIPTDMVPLRKRGNYLSMIGAMWALGSAGGPLIGGALSSEKNWPWIFWINLPFIAIGAVLIALFLRLKLISSSFATKLRRVDYVGAILFIASTTGLLIPLTWGGVSYAWSSWHTLVPLLVSIFGLAIFIVWEEKYAKEPLIAINVMKNRTAAATYFATFLHGLILWCLLYYMPLYYEAVKGYKPIIAGVALFPSTFTVAPAAIVVAIIVTKTGRYRWAIWLGWLLTTFGSGLMILQDVHTTIPQWIFINIVTGLGTGILFPSLGFAIQAKSSDKEMTSAVALFTFFRTFGQAVGVAIGGVIFQNQIRGQIESHPLIASNAAEWAKDSSALVEILKAMAEGPVKELLVQSYADALKTVWAVSCGLAGAALLASLWIEHYSLDRALNSEHAYVGEEKKVDEEKL